MVPSQVVVLLYMCAHDAYMQPGSPAVTQKKAATLFAVLYPKQVIITAGRNRRRCAVYDNGPNRTGGCDGHCRVQYNCPQQYGSNTRRPHITQHAAIEDTAVKMIFH